MKEARPTVTGAGQGAFASLERGWRAALAPVRDKINELERVLQEGKGSGHDYLPNWDCVLRAFTQPFQHVRVVILGQDPYPTPGHAIGHAFALCRHVQPLPPSLRNIYRELVDDTHVQVPIHGDLSHWRRQGVLLLNRILTLEPGQPGSHRGLGWEEVTDQAIRALADRRLPLVAILWGDDADGVRPLLSGYPVISSAHPSLATAHHGFFGSRPFSRANLLLRRQGAGEIDWSVE